MKQTTAIRWAAFLLAGLLLLTGCSTPAEPSDSDSDSSAAGTGGGTGTTVTTAASGSTGTADTSGTETTPSSVATLPTDTEWKDAVQVTVASLFCDNAVLQQGKSVPVWGTGPDGKTVTVRFADQVKTATVSGGTWRVNLDPMTANSQNQPMYITMDDERITVNRVLVGEVWLVNGQSNITVPFYALGMDDQKKERAKGDRDSLRQFWVTQDKSDTPYTTVADAKWAPCTADSIADYSATGYYFASRLQERLGVPVGIITSAVGGTYLEQWLDTVSLIKDGLCNPQPGQVGKKSHYNAMIAPLMPYAIKGIVWYQGESNQLLEYRNALYAKTFERYLEVYRAGFEDAELPVCQVQLPIFNSKDHWEALDGWAPFRYVQMGISQTQKNVYTAVTIDCGNAENIHPVDKEPIGERLMLLALRHVYGQDVQADSPVYRSHTVEGGTVTVTLDNVYSGLTVRGGTVTAARLKDASGVWHEAVCRVEGSTLVFTAAGVTEPHGVSYCDENAPTASVFEQNGLPLAPFRVEW